MNKFINFNQYLQNENNCFQNEFKQKTALTPPLFMIGCFKEFYEYQNTTGIGNLSNSKNLKHAVKSKMQFIDGHLNKQFVRIGEKGDYWFKQGHDYKIKYACVVAELINENWVQKILIFSIEDLPIYQNLNQEHAPCFKIEISETIKLGNFEKKINFDFKTQKPNPEQLPKTFIDINEILKPQEPQFDKLGTL